MSGGDSKKGRAGWRILIAGTGGQGVLSAARMLCASLVELGHDVVSGQLHGMAQRGGSVQSSVIIDHGISPVIPRGRADCVLGLEPVETVRALPYMSSETVVFMNTSPIIPYVLGQRTVLKQGNDTYPDVIKLSDSIRRVTSRVFSCDATLRAAEIGSSKALNMLMLGCLLGSKLLPCAADGFCDVVVRKMPSGFVEVNKKAFWQGVELGHAFAPAENMA